jgi:hypothetical protein
MMLPLSVVAILLAYLLDRSWSALHIKPPWWLDMPAALGFYGLCWRLYDEYLWRLGPVTRTLSGVPNLAGVWTGTILSSYRQEPFSATLTVRQTSSRLLITLETGNSKSYSTMAALTTAPGPASGLHYAYSNMPRPLSTPSMGPHTGTVQLALSADGTQLSGDYGTDRFRGTSGRMDFHRAGSRDSLVKPEASEHASKCGAGQEVVQAR